MLKLFCVGKSLFGCWAVTDPLETIADPIKRSIIDTCQNKRFLPLLVGPIMARQPTGDRSVIPVAGALGGANFDPALVVHVISIILSKTRKT